MRFLGAFLVSLSLLYAGCFKGESGDRDRTVGEFIDPVAFAAPLDQTGRALDGHRSEFPRLEFKTDRASVSEIYFRMKGDLPTSPAKVFKGEDLPRDFSVEYGPIVGGISGAGKQDLEMPRFEFGEKPEMPTLPGDGLKGFMETQRKRMYDRTLKEIRERR